MLSLSDVLNRVSQETETLMIAEERDIYLEKSSIDK